MLYLFSFLKSLQFFGSLAVPFYIVRLEYSYSQMFLLEMIFSVSLFLLEIPTGVVADKFGRKVSLFLGSLLFGLSFVGIGFVHSVAAFAVLQVVCAFGFSMLSGADRALVFENAKLRGKTDAETIIIASRYDAAGTAGMFVAFPAGSLFVASGAVAYKQALGIVFAATGVSSILAAIIILFVKEVPRSEKQSVGSALRHGIEGVKYIFKNKELRGFSSNYAVISALTFLMFWFYQSLLLENAVPVAWNGFIAAGFNALAMLLLLATGFIQKKLGSKNALFLSAIIPGILFVSVFLFPHSLPIVLVAIFGVTSLKMFRAPILQTLMNTKISDANRATVLSGVSMIERIIIAVFYPVAGFLMDKSMRYTYLLVGAAIILVSLLMCRDNLNTSDPSCK